MDFAEVIESIRAEDASFERLFRGEGRSARRGSPGFDKAVSVLEEIYCNAMDGSWRAKGMLREAMSTSDFPLLFGDVLDRMLLGTYQEAPYSWNTIVRRRTVPDFRDVKRFTMDGAEAVLAAVNQSAEYPAAALTEGSYSYAVKKYGRRVPFSWESMIDDDLDAFRDIPERLGRAVRRSEERFVTELFVDANGPHASFYTAGNANIVTGNPVLSITGLQTAMQVLAAMVDADGEPINIESMTLWVPPALEITAQNILNAVELRLTTEGGGTSASTLVATNWMKTRVTLAVGYYIPLVASSANGNTSWFLFANPETGRPAGEIGFLRGHETPDIRIKSANSQQVGGGLVDPLDGDFDTDSLQYRVRHVFGGSRMDAKASVASQGDGS